MTEKTGRAVIDIIAMELNGTLMGYHDDEPDKIWVTVSLWHWRRAYLTGAQPFADAAKCGVDELIGEKFVADVPFDPPPAEAEVGERLVWANLEPAPSMEEIKRRLGIKDEG